MTIRINIDALEQKLYEETGQHVSLQGQLVTVTAQVARVQPCEEHRLLATGEMWHDGGVSVSPNGYRPDCDACKAVPPILEDVSF